MSQVRVILTTRRNAHPGPHTPWHVAGARDPQQGRLARACRTAQGQLGSHVEPRADSQGARGAAGPVTRAAASTLRCYGGCAALKAGLDLGPYMKS
eukprot:4452502-Prymnesium_polylepis.1